jgi:hypothetical protein
LAAGVTRLDPHRGAVLARLDQYLVAAGKDDDNRVAFRYRSAVSSCCLQAIIFSTMRSDISALHVISLTISYFVPLAPA